MTLEDALGGEPSSAPGRIRLSIASTSPNSRRQSLFNLSVSGGSTYSSLLDCLTDLFADSDTSIPTGRKSGTGFEDSQNDSNE